MAAFSWDGKGSRGELDGSRLCNIRIFQSTFSTYSAVDSRIGLKWLHSSGMGRAARLSWIAAAVDSRPAKYSSQHFQQSTATTATFSTVDSRRLKYG